jgi:hypothetical protein
MHDREVHQRADSFVPRKARVRTSGWRRQFHRAMREPDLGKLTAGVHAAEAAIFLRWQELGEGARGNSEWNAMHAATEELLSIKVHKLKWPDFRVTSEHVPGSFRKP